MINSPRSKRSHSNSNSSSAITGRICCCCGYYTRRNWWATIVRCKYVLVVSAFIITMILLLLLNTMTTTSNSNNNHVTYYYSQNNNIQSNTNTNSKRAIITQKNKINNHNNTHHYSAGDDSVKSDMSTTTPTPTSLYPTKSILFHLAFTKPKITKLNLRCIESIFYFHPHAHVLLHSNAETGIHIGTNTKTQSSTTNGGRGGEEGTTTNNHNNKLLEPIQQLIDLGYHIEIIPYTATELLQKAMTMSNSIVNTTLASEWMSLIVTQYSQEIYWYSNESNLLRLCILYTRGGIYLDTDVILVRPMVPTSTPPNPNWKKMNVHNNITSTYNTITDNNGLMVDNVMARDGKSFECAVMKFTIPGNLFLGHAINNFLYNYNGTDWGNNGPRVFGRTAKEYPQLLCPEPYNYTTNIATTSSKASTPSMNNVVVAATGSSPCYMQPLPSISFQPVPWRKWYKYCFDMDHSPVGTDAIQIIRQPNVYAVHMNNHIYGKEMTKSIYIKHTICDIVMTKFCIVCQN